MATACRAIQDILNDTLATLSSRFGNFDRHTRDLWDNVSASRFREIETLIRSYHTAIGGVLCTLTVKMEAWRRAFPTNGAGGPQMRAEFIMSEIRQGLDTIAAIQRSAPELADLR
jgi:hypothetical protein